MAVNNKNTLLICVCGGSGSGKTTVSKEIKKILPKNISSQWICLDNFYRKDLAKTVQNSSHTNINFDHPNAFDWDLAFETIKKLMNAETAQMPVYDYVNSRRSDKVTIVNPVDVIIFEGILTLYDPRINELASIKIFVDTPDDERFIRRLLRDKNERGRNDDNVISQWRNVVRPMFKTFIAPQKANADIVIPWYRMNTIAIHAINGAIQELIKSNKI